MNVISYEGKIVEEELRNIDYTICVKRQYKKKSIRYINLPCAFDIETSNIDELRIGVMYEWTFGISNLVIIGRRWEEFDELIEILNKVFNLSVNTLLCYIHNLSFEFQFIRKRIGWVDVFSTDSRNPIKALSNKGIEFRDNVILSGTDLRTVARNLSKHKISKLNTLDYYKVRNYETYLSEDEIQYCINDVVIVLYYIEEQMEIYGNVANIPLTNTGRVRRYCSNYCLKTTNKEGKECRDLNYVEKVQNLRMTPELYDWTKKAFRGGFVHANTFNSRSLISDVDSWDKISAYIWALDTKKYPSSNFVKVEDLDSYKFNYYINNRCCLFKMTFYNIDIKDDAPDAYISYIGDKMYAEGYKPLDNGRIRHADLLTIYLTEVDYKIIERIYKWDRKCCDSIYVAFKDYLPKKLIECTLSLYRDKTVLKGSEDVMSYQLLKSLLNSVYGMIVQDNIGKGIYNYNGKWSHTDNNIEEEINRYNSSKSRFTFYCWGLWVTAYCRESLWDAIINMGVEDQIYSDTDSVKCCNGDKHMEYFERYNNSIAEDIKKVCDHYKLDISYFYPMNKYGEVKMLGAWEYEGRYNKFKTLGAKQYMHMEEIEYGPNKVCPIKFINKHGRFNGDKFEEYTLTCSGVTKKAIDYLLKSNDPFKEFSNNLVVPAEYTGKLASVYNDDEINITITDYLGNSVKCKELSSVYLTPVEFSLEEGDSFIDWIKEEIFNVQI